MQLATSSVNKSQCKQKLNHRDGSENDHIKEMLFVLFQSSLLLSEFNNLFVYMQSLPPAHSIHVPAGKVVMVRLVAEM